MIEYELWLLVGSDILQNLSRVSEKAIPSIYEFLSLISSIKKNPQNPPDDSWARFPPIAAIAFLKS